MSTSRDNSTVVFAAGQTPVGNKFATWAALEAVYLARPDVDNIVIDDSVAPCIIPAGAHTGIRDTTVFRGSLIAATGAVLQFADLATINQIPVVDDGLTIQSNSSIPVLTVAGANITTLLRNYSGLICAGAGRFIHNASATFIISITLQNGGALYNGTASIVHLVDPGAGVAVCSVNAESQGFIEDDTFSSGGGNVYVNIDLIDPNNHLSFTQTGFTSALFNFGDLGQWFSDHVITSKTSQNVATAAATATPGETLRYNPTGGTFTLKVPGPSESRWPGCRNTFKNQSNSATAVTIDPTGADTIDGVAAPGAFSIAGSRLSITFEWDGISDWMSV